LSARKNESHDHTYQGQINNGKSVQVPSGVGWGKADKITTIVMAAAGTTRK
jgi:hypothetical protein